MLDPSSSSLTIPSIHFLPFQTKIWKSPPEQCLLNPTMDVICLGFTSELWIGRFTYWEMVWTRPLNYPIETIAALSWTKDGSVLCIAISINSTNPKTWIEFRNVHDGTCVHSLPSLQISGLLSILHTFQFNFSSSLLSDVSLFTNITSTKDTIDLSSLPITWNSISLQTYNILNQTFPFSFLPSPTKLTKKILSNQKEEKEIHVTIAIIDYHKIILRVFGSVCLYSINLADLISFSNDTKIIRAIVNTHHHVLHCLVETNASSLSFTSSSSLKNNFHTNPTQENPFPSLLLFTVLVPELQNLHSRLPILNHIQQLNHIILKIKKKIKLLTKNGLSIHEKIQRHWHEYQDILIKNNLKINPSTDCIRVLLTFYSTDTFKEFLNQCMSIKHLNYWKSLVEDWYKDTQSLLNDTLTPLLKNFHEHCSLLLPHSPIPQPQYSSNLTLLFTFFFSHIELAKERFTKFYTTFLQFNLWLQSFLVEDPISFDTEAVHEFCNLFWRNDSPSFLAFIEPTKISIDLSLPILPTPSTTISFHTLVEKLDAFYKELQSLFIHPSSESKAQLIHSWHLCSLPPNKKLSHTYLTEINQGDIFISVFVGNEVLCLVSFIQLPDHISETWDPFRFQGYLTRFSATQATDLLGWIFPSSSSTICPSGLSLTSHLQCLLISTHLVWMTMLPKWPKDPWIYFNDTFSIRSDPLFLLFPEQQLQPPLLQTKKYPLSNPVDQEVSLSNFNSNRKVVALVLGNRTTVYDLDIE